MNTIKSIRQEFPFLDSEKMGKSIIYLDNSATTQKPQCVIDSLSHYYSYQNANPHRGAHYLAMTATELYEKTRATVAHYLNAKKTKEIIFTRNATEALNLIAYTYALNTLKPGDEILISILEHHANLCSWQFVAEKTGACLKYVYLTNDFQVDMKDFQEKLNEQTKIVSITACSNVTASIQPIQEMFRMAHAVGAITILDAAQFCAHYSIDVQALDCDFLAFSGHKMYASMGCGVLYGKFDLLNSMKPFLYGGDIVEYVYEDHTIFLEPNQRFEAGTPNVGAVITLGKAIEYIESIGLKAIHSYETMLTDYAYEKMKELPFVTLYTPQDSPRGPLIAFTIDDIHPHDTSSILDSYGIAIRSGHHCAEPLHRYLKINASSRVSFALYNTTEEIDAFIEGLKEVRKVMGYGH